MLTRRPTRRGKVLLYLSLICMTAGSAVSPAGIGAQTAPAAKAASQLGTVKSIDGSNLNVTTDDGRQVVVAVPSTARLQRLAPGSTDLKTAETATLPDVLVGDRVLVTGTAGETPGTLNAARVILMKSSDIAQKRAAEQQDWQRHGTGGIVTAIDSSSGAISVSAGTRKLEIVTTPATTYRRYADGSVKFEDAKPGTLAEIHIGDQLLARGAKSENGTSLQATEVVSGSFKNFSGTILSIDAASNALSIKDLVTQRSVTMQLTASSAVHRLPPQAAAMFAVRAHGGDSTGSGRPLSSPAAPASPAAPSSAAGDPSGGGRAASPGRSGAGDLSQMVARLPQLGLSDLHPGEAVIIVAEQSSADAARLTAITVLAGVEPILAAAPGGSSAMTLSPWSVGSGAPEGGGSQ